MLLASLEPPGQLSGLASGPLSLLQVALLWPVLALGPLVGLWPVLEVVLLSLIEPCAIFSLI